MKTNTASQASTASKRAARSNRDLEVEIETLQEAIARCESDPTDPQGYFLADYRETLARDKAELASRCASPDGRPDYRTKTIGGIRVSLLFGETKVDHFGRAPVVAVSYKDPQGKFVASWFPLHVWQGIPFDPMENS